MKLYTQLQCFFAVFFCFVNLGYNAQPLGLNEGDICRKGSVETANFICQNINSCPFAVEEINQNTTAFEICSYKGNISIVCCPPKPYSAIEMCENYSKLIYFKIENPTLTPSSDFVEYTDCVDVVPLITNGTAAEPKEFPHMVLLSYSEKKPDDDSWLCGGSLISKNFVLTAAHCEKSGYSENTRFATWARLGELDYLSETDNARPTDYKIVQRIIHPNYTSASLYHDIALFRLERDVDFSAFVRPICLYTDTILRPPTVVATGWGRTATDKSTSSHLLKVQINTISTDDCDNSFSYLLNRKIKLANGIVEKSMLCAGNPEGGNGTCKGDSGGPIQIKHISFKCMYSQIGITSFGGPFCGAKQSPTVYTRVSNYISWIERNVWPKI